MTKNEWNELLKEYGFQRVIDIDYENLTVEKGREVLKTLIECIEELTPTKENK